VRTPLALVLCGFGIVLSGVAAADDKADCLTAASQGQQLRNAHKLVEAIGQFRVCARLQCPAVVQKDCLGWLDESERDVPTVVVSAKDATGADLFDVRVVVDGTLLTTRLDGEAVPMDAGQRKFHFEIGDGPSLELSILVREGQKNQNVDVVLPTPAKRLPLLPPTTVVAPQPSAVTPGPGTLEPATARPAGAGTWRTIGWILTAAGGVSLAVGTGFGIAAIRYNDDAHCNAQGFCDAGPLASARSAALVADVGLVGGGLLVASGLAAVLLAPGGGRDKAARTGFAPMVSSGGGGLSLGGRW
jgi:hypothetical protein